MKKIDTTNVRTIGDLLGQIDGFAPDTQIEFVRTPKRQQENSCWCGCGQTTKNRFVPGHDARFHGLAKRVARGEERMPDTFVNDEARADFMRWHDAELPLHEERVREQARVKALREAARIERRAEKEETRTGRVVEMVEIDDETADLLAEMG